MIKVFGIDLSDYVSPQKGNVDKEIMEFSDIGWVDSTSPNTLTYALSTAIAKKVILNPNITGVLVGLDEIQDLNFTIPVVRSEDPVHVFYSMYNAVAKLRVPTWKSRVAASAKISKLSTVSHAGVEVGEDVVIEDGCHVLAGSVLGDGVILRTGSVVGAEGFEHKRTSLGVISAVHDGLSILENNVELGANTTVDKGIFGRNTVIGCNSKIDNQVHVGHRTQIGENVFVAAGCTISGSVTIENDCWIGPGSTISNGVFIGEAARVTLGSVVVKDVVAGETVSGNFAIPHKSFLKVYRAFLKPILEHSNSSSSKK
jgi:UDP-3-O-[3-hydroxymyristoyl] glucosamine N-acyltransferase